MISSRGFNLGLSDAYAVQQFLYIFTDCMGDNVFHEGRQ